MNDREKRLSALEGRIPQESELSREELDAYAAALMAEFTAYLDAHPDMSPEEASRSFAPEEPLFWPLLEAIASERAAMAEWENIP